MPTPAADTVSNNCEPASGYAALIVNHDRPLLHVRVASRDVAVPTDRVRAVIKAEHLTRLPRTDAPICGLISVDDEVVGVVDLALHLGLDRTRLGRRSCVVIVDPPAPADDDGPMAWRLRDATREPRLALLVDELHGLLEPGSAALPVTEAIPHGACHGNEAAASLPRALLAGIAVHRERRLPLLDLGRLLDPETLAGPGPQLPCH